MTPTVLITGASQGTGRATARLFAQRGYNLVLAARQAERLEAIAQEINQSGCQTLAVPTDVADASAVDRLVHQALDRFGSVDVLVNNAGICLTGTMEHTSLEDWQQILNTNLWGYIHTIHALLPQFIERQQGAIVNVGSFGGKMPLTHMTAYCTSKYAVTGLTDTLRLELAPQGIHVGLVNPGLINSQFLERAQFRGASTAAAEQQRQQMAQAMMQSWASRPEDVAQAIWEVVTDRKMEVGVGATAIATEAYRLLPGLVQWAMARLGRPSST
ncbi:MAG TPA: SDR family oxidoreductase [Candidatus Obscuribacterales bacterium]